MDSEANKSNETDLSNRKEPTVGGWIASDRREVPEYYSQSSFVDFGTEDISKARYISREFHDLEQQYVWPRAWQMACHLDQIAAVGDYVVYDIGNLSMLVVRTSEAEIKSYRNACLHRGMALAMEDGNTKTFTCPFHGWSWNLDGTMRNLPEDWDFPQIDKKMNCLPEAQVGIWGKFVFINLDPDAEPFDQYTGCLDEHFQRAPYEDRDLIAHFARVLPANWKLSMEAFMEAYHVSPTHPEVVPVAEYAETQCDTWAEHPNVSRMLTVSVAQASGAVKNLSQQEFADYVSKQTGREPIDVPEGSTFRQALAEQRRKEAGSALGKDLSHLSDVEMIDAVEYYLFPNFLPWHGFGLPIVYRFRPNGDQHDSSIMEVFMLGARSENMPAPNPVWISEDEPFSSEPRMGRLGPIFDQDVANIVGMQKGLKASAKEGLSFSHYQESRIRHYHRRIDEFIEKYSA